MILVSDFQQEISAFSEEKQLNMPLALVLYRFIAILIVAHVRRERIEDLLALKPKAPRRSLAAALATTCE